MAGPLQCFCDGEEYKYNKVTYFYEEKYKLWYNFLDADDEGFKG